MLIRFVDYEEGADSTPVPVYSEPYHIDSITEKRGRGNFRSVVIGGRYVARDGVLCEGVEDITQYKTVLVDGVKTKVEVLPEEIVEPRPDSTWYVADIKAWLDLNEVPYTSSMLKADLLALV
jgi:hypothetical protein